MCAYPKLLSILPSNYLLTILFDPFVIEDRSLKWNTVAKILLTATDVNSHTVQEGSPDSVPWSPFHLRAAAEVHLEDLDISQNKSRSPPAPTSLLNESHKAKTH